ncbi:response regulator [Sphingobium algorifonticola]|uniref:histidine kinase n=1 Tax=Sphingobium algorifonticola TaxID=2008318 RepID=A0A437J532_9SPHN|nr:response regulator [Sphingobium algorifonticola]RVT39871.1 response regulator [Sphingobium algorifonticola]
MFSSFLDDYMPHGYCLLWRPELVWTHVVSDALIALAYFSIPIALIRFIRARRDIQFGGIFWLFAIFIMACGTTHIMAIWTLWNGDYGIEALIKVVTAIASVLTAIVLWPLIPKALALPSTAQLRTANDALASRIAERDAALSALRIEEEERRKAEAALLQSRKIEAVGQLTGGIAHDFNNLLQAVAGNIELIALHGSGHDKIARLASNATAALDRGRTLTSQLLAFSRIQRLELKPVRVGLIITGMSDLLQRTLGPQIRYSLEGTDEGLAVMADRTQLELALLNLAINSRDAMPQGGQLSITAAPYHQPQDEDDLPAGEYVDIVVADTGIGMPADVLERAFEPFFTTKPVGKGTGLGLSMVFGIARQSGGTLLIDSQEGNGTRVTLRLRRVAQATETTAPNAVASSPERLDAIRILVIDDDTAVRETVVEALEAMGAAVQEAARGTTGIAMAEAEDYDIVLLDFAMPDMNGAAVAQAIAKKRPRLPIIFASGYADTDALDAAMDGAVTMLRKPFSHRDLVTAILSALRNVN